MSDKLTDPDKFGPVMWYIIHNSALKLGENEFIDWLRITLSSIPCLDCRNHALEYIDDNDPNSFKNIHNEDGELIGMFQWTWKFHNDVNIRLNKKLYDFQEVYRMYTNESTMCSDRCGN